MKRHTATVTGRGLLASLLLSLVPVGSGLAADVPPANVSWSYGWGSFSHAERWAPVHVHVSGARRNLAGEIEVRCSRNSFVRSIQVPAGGDHRFFLACPEKPGVVVFRPDDDEEIQATAGGGGGRVLSTQAVLSLVLADSRWHHGCNWLETSAAVPHAFVQEAHRVFLDPVDLPPSSLGLDGVDLVVAGPADWSRVDRSRQDALAAWVLSGGQLVVPVGARADRFRRTVVEELLPVRLDGTTPLSSLAELGRLHGDGDDEILLDDLPPFQAAVARPRPGAEVLARSGEHPLVCRWRVGAGEVTFLAMGIDESPLSGRAAGVRRRLWAEEMRRARIHGMGRLRPQDVQLAYDERDRAERWERIRRSLANEDLEPPSSWAVLSFILVYLVLVGPLQYFVLSRLGRLEAAWVVTPVIVLLFSAGAFLMGASRGGNESVLTALTVWHRQDVCRLALRRRFIKVFSDWNRHIDVIATGRDGAVLPFPLEARYGWEKPPWTGRPLWSEEGLSMTRRSVHLWSEAAFVASEIVEDGPRVDGSLLREGRRVSGWIENRGLADLVRPCLVAGRVHLPLAARIGPGERFAVAGELRIPVHAQPRPFRDLSSKGCFWADHVDEELDERLTLVALVADDGAGVSVRPPVDRHRGLGLLVQRMNRARRGESRRVVDDLPVVLGKGFDPATMQVAGNVTAEGHVELGRVDLRDGERIETLRIYAGKSNLEFQIGAHRPGDGGWTMARRERHRNDLLRPLLVIDDVAAHRDAEGRLRFQIRNLNGYCNLEIEDLHVRAVVGRGAEP